MFDVKFTDAATNTAELATKEVRAAALEVLQRNNRQWNDASKGWL